MRPRNKGRRRMVNDMGEALEELDAALRELETAAASGGAGGADGEVMNLKKRIRKLRAERQEHFAQLESLKADRVKDAEMIEDALEELRALD